MADMNVYHKPIALIFAGLVTLVGCQGSRQAQSTEPAAATRPSQIESQARQPSQALLWIKGMACPFCTYNVERQLSRVPGVQDVRVDLASGRAVVTLSKDHPATEEQLRSAVKTSGFTVDRVEMP